jgi:hypothetical protein
VVRVDMRAPGWAVRRPPAEPVIVILSRYVAGREKHPAARLFI